MAAVILRTRAGPAIASISAIRPPATVNPTTVTAGPAW
jgi:hypothetical protein